MSLAVSGLTFAYGDKTILDQLQFSLPGGQVLGLLGPNGAGKTTLLKAIGGLHRAEGSCRLEGEDLWRLTPAQRARRVAYVPQSAPAALPAQVLEVVLMGRMPYVRFTPTRADKEAAAAILERLGLAGLAFRYMGQLSGGERQRVLIARAIAQQPRLLLLDEPTSSLDLKNQLQTMELVRALARGEGITAVLSIHDINLAAMYCDRFLLLQGGRCVAFGEPGQVLTEENLRAVYGVRAEMHRLNGVCHAVLLPPEGPPG